MGNNIFAESIVFGLTASILILLYLRIRFFNRSFAFESTKMVIIKTKVNKDLK
jgi:hypothetical protein